MNDTLLITLAIATIVLAIIGCLTIVETNKYKQVASNPVNIIQVKQ